MTGAVSRLCDFSLLLLAGGSGVRMGGENKLLLKAGSLFLTEALLDRIAPLFTESVLLVRPGAARETREALGPVLARHGVRISEDRESGRGPLEGLCRGLAEMRSDWGFLCGCDMPAVSPDAVTALASLRTEGAQITAAELNGFIEPLHAFYHKSCLPLIEEALRRGERKIKCFYKDADMQIVPEAALAQLCPDYKRSFLNINRPEELEKYKKTLAAAVYLPIEDDAAI